MARFSSVVVCATLGLSEVAAVRLSAQNSRGSLEVLSSDAPPIDETQAMEMLNHSLGMILPDESVHITTCEEAQGLMKNKSKDSIYCKVMNKLMTPDVLMSVGAPVMGPDGGMSGSDGEMPGGLGGMLEGSNGKLLEAMNMLQEVEEACGMQGSDGEIEGEDAEMECEMPVGASVMGPN